MRKVLTLFAVATLALYLASDRAAQAAPPVAGGAPAQALPGNDPATNNAELNSPPGSNALPQSNTAGSNPASSTEGANNNPPGSNAPASRTFENPTPGNPANAQMRQDLRENRQNFRQDLRNERQENRLERQSNLNDPNRWRFVLQNGEWWYWLPNNSWAYWRDNQWMPYEADNFQPSGYRVGYRGIGNGSTMFYFDENGLRYRRDYSPGRPQNSEMQQMHEPPKSM